MNYKKIKTKLLVVTALSTIAVLQMSINSIATDKILNNNEMYLYANAPVGTFIREYNYIDLAFANVDGYTYIREEPTSDSKWIGKMYNKNAATILGVKDNWLEIKSGSVQGYVESKYLITGIEAHVMGESVGSELVTINIDNLNIRKSIGTDSSVIGTVEKGTVLLKTGCSIEGWCPVEYRGERGYISEKYVLSETVYAYAESKEEEQKRIQEYEQLLEKNKQAIEPEAQEAFMQELIKSSNANSGEKVIEYAKQFIGNPYVWGGTDLNHGADCSGFIQSVYKNFDIKLPRTSLEQRSAGYEVAYEDAQLGDIICYNGHVGLYVGDDKILNAIGKNKGIGITSALYKQVLSVRRVI